MLWCGCTKGSLLFSQLALHYKEPYLVHTKVAMSVGDIPAGFVWERVQHAVVWMHRRKPVVLKLLSDYGN